MPPAGGSERRADRPGPAEGGGAHPREAAQGLLFCVLTPEGRLLSSEQLADTLRQAKLGGRSGACFLIGSSFGIAPEIKALADLQLSMSKMTFPHHLARVMALEQLYRAEAIQAGSKYHK